MLHRLCLVLLPNEDGQITRSYGGPTFEAEARERLPEIDLSDCDRAVHLVMGRLAKAGREAIRSGDLQLLQRLFEFVASAAGRPDANGEIENAVVISFLEPADFAGPHGAAARDLVPVRLRALIDEAV